MSTAGKIRSQPVDPGVAKVSDLLTHWNVCEETARKIIHAAGLVPVDGGVERYRWRDVWHRIEGEPVVPHWDWEAFKAPLLQTEDLVADGVRGRSAETIRRNARIGKIPLVRLDENNRRFRRVTLQQFFSDV